MAVYEDSSIIAAKYLLKFAGAWLTKNSAEKFQRKISLMYMAIGILYAIYVTILNIYYAWGDVDTCMFLFINMGCISLAVIKMVKTNIFREEFIEIVEYATRNFWHYNYNPVEQNFFSECRMVCKLYTIFIYLLLFGALSGYVLTPIIRNIGLNKSDRVLPFREWVEISETPYYELMFFFQYRLLNVWDSTNEKMDITDYTDRCSEQLRNCVHQHQMLIEYCNKLEHMYALMNCSNLLVSGVLLSFDCYEIFLADISNSQMVIFIGNLIGTIVEIVTLTYSCHLLMEESMNVLTAIYSGSWLSLPMNKVGRSLRTNVKVIMMRALRPCCLTAAGFFPLTLETNTALLSTVFSYFTLIKETTT